MIATLHLLSISTFAAGASRSRPKSACLTAQRHCSLGPVRSARSGAACAWILFAKNQVRFNESNRIIINKHLKISCCNCGWLKSRKQVEPVLTVVWCNEIKHFPPRAQSCGRTPRARAPAVPAHPNCNCNCNCNCKYLPCNWWCLNRFKPVDRFTMRTICRTFWTGSGRDCHAYSEPVHAPEPDQNRHNVKRRCVNRG